MNIPEAMIEAAAVALTDDRIKRWGYSEMLADGLRAEFLADPNTTADVRAVLAAALSTCTIREEWGHSRKVAGAQWHSHRCPTADQYRLVIETAPERTTGE